MQEDSALYTMVLLVIHNPEEAVQDGLEVLVLVEVQQVVLVVQGKHLLLQEVLLPMQEEEEVLGLQLVGREVLAVEVLEGLMDPLLYQIVLLIQEEVEGVVLNLMGIKEVVQEVQEL